MKSASHTMLQDYCFFESLEDVKKTSAQIMRFDGFVNSTILESMQYSTTRTFLRLLQSGVILSYPSSCVTLLTCSFTYWYNTSSGRLSLS